VLLKVKHSLALTLKTSVVQFFHFVTYNLWFWVVFLISEIKILLGLFLLRIFRITKPLTLNPKPLKLCNQKNICFEVENFQRTGSFHERASKELAVEGRIFDPVLWFFTSLVKGHKLVLWN
jgi:hypothetical protein